MIEKIRHRGPDSHAVIEAPNGALGHTRLAILDLDGGAQPMAFGDYQIAFNGEIYNHQALRAQYLSNAPLKTHSDTEVLLHLYAQLGPEMISRLDGMFAIAILKDDALFLARDPIGL
ncbi:MAG TPA: asparagine synthetase B, partial [Anaerolineaceae bacterium]|nr:asparagine synthetase B [Anaerolineaceae bacterium]